MCRSRSVRRVQPASAKPPDLPSASRPTPAAGFTLIELLTVIAIIAILAAIVIGAGRRVSESGRIARAKAELAALGAALESYRQHFGDYPRVVSDDNTSSSASDRFLFEALNGQRGPALNGTLVAQQRVFVEKAMFSLADPIAADSASNRFLDPWGNAYHYAYVPGSAWKNSSYVLFSCGPDGQAAMPFPADGIRTTAYDSVLQSGHAVNADNIYANQ